MEIYLHIDSEPVASVVNTPSKSNKTAFIISSLLPIFELYHVFTQYTQKQGMPFKLWHTLLFMLLSISAIAILLPRN